MKTPLRYPGGKSRAVKHILPYIPLDCGSFCAPFLGGASIELAVADRGTKVYGYDLFEPIVWFWQALLESPEKLADIADSYRVENEYEHKGQKIKAYGLPKETFKKFREDIKLALENKEQFSYELAAKVYAVNRSSFSGATLSGGFSKRASYARFTDSSIERIRQFKEPNLIVSQADFKESIERHPDSFLYCDPPYFLGKDKDKLYGVNGDKHEGFNHKELHDLLSKRSGWVLSYNSSEEIRELYSDFKIIEAKWAYGMNKTKKSSEIIIVG